MELSEVLGSTPRQNARTHALTFFIHQIKSVQLEFVKHSLLTRKLIKFDKEIEKLQFNHGPVAARVRKWMRILRVVVYAAFAYYVNFTTKVVLLEPLIIWPLSWFCRRVEEVSDALNPIFIHNNLCNLYQSQLFMFRSTTTPRLSSCSSPWASPGGTYSAPA